MSPKPGKPGRKRQSPTSHKGKIFTSSRIEMKSRFDPGDLPPSSEIGAPGKYPFTRGNYPEMYRSKPWTIRQYAGFGTAEETNKRYKFLLSQGQTGLSVAFDLPTQCGYDSDHEMSAGEVGKVGVSLNTIDDMETLFEGIPLEKVSVSMTINSTAIIVLAFYLAAAKRRGIRPSKLTGTLQNDILKEYIARGTYIFPPEPSLRLTTDIIEFSSRNLPQWNPISISGYHIREAGSNAVQEIAFAIADGMEHVRHVIKRRMNIDHFAGRLSFFFACHSNFLEEIAKFRAARRIWAKIMRKKFKARNPRSWMMRFHTQTGGATLTAQQPLNNTVRTTIQALAAVLGGTQSLHTNALDEALSIPTAESALLALRTQQILAEESGMTDTADPIGGSWCLEALTTEIEKGVETYLKKIEKMGGMAKAILFGYPQMEILDSACIHQRQVESGEKTIVGVNKFREVADKVSLMPIHRTSEDAEDRQIEKLSRFKSRRKMTMVTEALERLDRDARKGRNLVPAVIHAVESYATIGEISDTLRGVFGIHKEKIVI